MEPACNFTFIFYCSCNTFGWFTRMMQKVLTLFFDCIRSVKAVRAIIIVLFHSTTCMWLQRLNHSPWKLILSNQYHTGGNKLKIALILALFFPLFSDSNNRGVWKCSFVHYISGNKKNKWYHISMSISFYFANCTTFITDIANMNIQASGLFQNTWGTCEVTDLRSRNWQLWSYLAICLFISFVKSFENICILYHSSTEMGEVVDIRSREILRPMYPVYYPM